MLLTDNKYIFKNINHINTVKLDIEDFNLDLPVSFILKTVTYDGEINNHNIIPFSHNGLFKEYFELDKKNKSYFKITNKDNIYFYSCRYDKNGFVLGNELKLIFEKDYYFEDDMLVFDEGIKHKEIVVLYLPSYDSYEIKVNQKIRLLEIIILNDKLNIDKKLKKKLVIE